MFRILIAASCLFGSLAATPSAAAEPGSSTTLTHQALADQVRSANPNVAAARAALEASRRRIDPATALDDPQFRYSIAPASIGVSGLDTGHIVGFSQPLPWPGKLARRGDVAEAEADVARAELGTAMLAAVSSARVAYAEWRYTEAALRSNQAQQALLAELADTARGIYRAGAGSQSAVLSAQLRKGERQRQALVLRQQSASLRAQINALRHAHIDAELPSPAPSETLPNLPAEDRLRTALETGHPQLAALSARVQAADSRVALTRLDRRPDIRLDVNYLGTLPREENRAQVGVAINLPFGLGGRQKRASNIAAADADRHAAMMRRADLSGRLAAELAEAIAIDASARAQIALTQNTLLPLAQQSLDAATADYASSGGPAAALLDAAADALNVRIALDRARADALQARARIDTLTGGTMTTELFGELQ